MFGAVYGISWDDQGRPNGLVAYKEAHVVDAAAWQASLNTEYDQPITAMEISGPLGYTVPSILALAAIEYRKQQRPHWSTVQPFYGQSPV